MIPKGPAFMGGDATLARCVVGKEFASTIGSVINAKIAVGEASANTIVFGLNVKYVVGVRFACISALDLCARTVEVGLSANTRRSAPNAKLAAGLNNSERLRLKRLKILRRIRQYQERSPASCRPAR